jgi:hypothetical protein
VRARREERALAAPQVSGSPRRGATKRSIARLPDASTYRPSTSGTNRENGARASSVALEPAGFERSVAAPRR